MHFILGSMTAFTRASMTTVDLLVWKGSMYVCIVEIFHGLMDSTPVFLVLFFKSCFNVSLICLLTCRSSVRLNYKKPGSSLTLCSEGSALGCYL